jgi:hypothetical protein
MKKSAVFGILLLGVFLVSILNANLIVAGSCPSDAACVEASKCENCAGLVAKTTTFSTYCANDGKRYRLDYRVYCSDPQFSICNCRADCTSTSISGACQSGDECLTRCGTGQICSGRRCVDITSTCDSERSTRCTSTSPAMCGTWSFTGCTGTTNCTTALSGSSCPSGSVCNSSTFGRCIVTLPNCTLSNCQAGQCGNWSYPGTCLGNINCSTGTGTTFPPSSNGCIIGGTCNSSMNGTCVYRNFQCFRNSTSSIWYNGTQTQAVTNCSRYYSTNVSTCCKEGFTCNFTSGSCVNGAAISQCSSYRNSASCLADDMNVARNSVNNSQSCGFSQVVSPTCSAKIECRCVWENNICKGFKGIAPQCPGNNVPSNCTWAPAQLENADCANPDKPIKTTAIAIFQGNDATLRAGCNNIVREYPCVSTEKLPFFGGFNFLLSIVSIALIYVVFSRKNK